MAIYKEWKPKNVHQRLKRWLPKAAPRIFEETENVHKHLRGEPLRFGYGTLTGSLSSLGVWYGAQFVVGAFEGEPGARAELRRSFECERRSKWVLWAHWTARGFESGLGPTLDGPTLHLAKGISLGLFQESAEYGRLILYGIRKGYYTGIQVTRVIPFVLGLFCDWQGLPAPPPETFAPMPDFYAAVLSGWRGEAGALAAPLLEACDFHTERSRNNNNREFFEFSAELYRVFPAEILAVFSLRRELGLELPAINHPLLSLPTATFGDPPGLLDEDLFRKLDEKLTQDFPNFNVG